MARLPPLILYRIHGIRLLTSARHGTRASGKIDLPFRESAATHQFLSLRHRHLLRLPGFLDVIDFRFLSGGNFSTLGEK